MNKRSFTLVELLVTVAVAVLVIGGVLISLINSMILNEYNQKFTIAMNIARAQLEEVISERSNFDSIAPLTDTRLMLASDRIDGRCRIAVTPVDGSSGELKTVIVSVCWRGRAGRIIGDCAADLSSWTGVSPSSPCTLQTAIAKR